MSVINNLHDFLSEYKKDKAIVVDFTICSADTFDVPGRVVLSKVTTLIIKSEVPVHLGKHLVVDDCKYIFLKNVHFDTISSKNCSVIIYNDSEIDHRVVKFKLPSSCHYVKICGPEIDSESILPKYCNEFQLRTCRLGKSLTLCNVGKVEFFKVDGILSNIIIKTGNSVNIQNCEFYSLVALNVYNFQCMDTSLTYYFKNDVKNGYDYATKVDNSFNDNGPKESMIISLLKI